MAPRIREGIQQVRGSRTRHVRCVLRSMNTPSPSKRLERWLPATRFRDVVAVSSIATPEQLQQAFEDVTSREMSARQFLALVRGQPSQFEDSEQASLLDVLTRVGGVVVLERLPHEIVFGMISVGDDTVSTTAAAFSAYSEPGAEKFLLSARGIATRNGAQLVLEYGTADRVAPRRLRDWRLRLRGPSKTRRLLESVVKRAERPSQAARVRARAREASFPRERAP